MVGSTVILRISGAVLSLTLCSRPVFIVSGPYTQGTDIDFIPLIIAASHLGDKNHYM